MINKPTRTPVRKLKTAAELLEESKKSASLPSDRPRCHSLDVPRQPEGESDVSDKENNRYSTVSDLDASSWIPIDANILHDVTNCVTGTTSGTVASSRSQPLAYPSSSSPGEHTTTRGRGRFCGPHGDDDVWLSRKELETPLPSEQLDFQVAAASSPTSPTTIERRLYRLFGRHFNSPSPLRSHSKNTGASGALNTLCRNTLSMDLDSSSGGEEAWGVSPPSSPGTKSGGGETSQEAMARDKKGRARFLDKTWLQKPKKFFKF